MRRANQPGVNTNGQFRVVGDQLGSTTLIIDTASVPNVTQREYYKPFGEVAFTSGSSRTDKGFTGQRLDASSGLMYYGARYYDPVLSYFISADTIVPGNAEGRGGGAATLGVDDKSKLTSLTTDFHETAFLGEAQKENLQNTEKGFWFQLSDKEKKDPRTKYQWGPKNPQALNRYSYTLNNPLRYVDPTGHFLIEDIIIPVVAAFAGGLGSVIGALLAKGAPLTETETKNAFISGFVAGLSTALSFILGPVAGIIAQAVGSAVGTFVANLITKGLTYTLNNLREVLVSGIVGAVAGVVTKGIKIPGLTSADDLLNYKGTGESFVDDPGVWAAVRSSAFGGIHSFFPNFNPANYGMGTQ